MRKLTVLLFIVSVIVSACAAGCKCVPASKYDALEKENRELREENLELYREVLALKTRVYCLEEAPILVDKRQRWVIPHDYFDLFPLSRYEFIPRRVYGPLFMSFALKIIFPHLPSLF